MMKSDDDDDNFGRVTSLCLLDECKSAKKCEVVLMM